VNAKKVATVEQLIFLQLVLQICQDSSLLSDLQACWLPSSSTSSVVVLTGQEDMQRFWSLVLQQLKGILYVSEYEILHPLTLSSAEDTSSLAQSTSSSPTSSTTSVEQILDAKDLQLQQSIAQDFVQLVWDCLAAFLTIIYTPTTSTLTHPTSSVDVWMIYLVEQQEWLGLGQICLHHFDMIARHKYIGQIYAQLPSTVNQISLKEYEKHWMSRYFTSFHQTLVKLVLQCWQHTLVHSSYLQSYFYDHKEYLHILLAYCVTDFYNPLTREWAFFTIHSLTQHHAGIRDYLDSLQLQGVEINKSEELQKAGIEVKLDKATGKISFVQKPPVVPPLPPVIEVVADE